MLESLQMSKKGQAMGVRELFTALAVSGVIAIIGLLIFSNVTANVNQDSFTTAQNTTAGKIKDTVLDSFELGIIALIVLAAVVILATVYMLGR